VPVQAVVKRAIDSTTGDEVTGSAAEGLDTRDAVYVVIDDKTVIRPVKTGVSDVLYVEIIDGLEEGDEVVIGPYRTLKKLEAGEAVRTERKNEETNGGRDESDSVEVRID